jgi:hypothetical protein
MKGEVMLNSLLNSIADTIFLEVLLISVMISATMAGCAAQTPAPSVMIFLFVSESNTLKH